MHDSHLNNRNKFKGDSVAWDLKIRVKLLYRNPLNEPILTYWLCLTNGSQSFWAPETSRLICVVWNPQVLLPAPKTCRTWWGQLLRLPHLLRLCPFPSPSNITKLQPTDHPCIMKSFKKEEIRLYNYIYLIYLTIRSMRMQTEQWKLGNDSV